MSQKEIMKRTINLAISTMEKGNTPFASIVTRNGDVISEAVNKITSDQDPTAHAELLAIRKAAKVLGRSDLSDCELYASGEPCTMCLSAIYFSGIKKVYVAYPQEEANKHGVGNPYVREQLKLDNDERDIHYTIVQPGDTPHPYIEWNKKEKDVK